MPMGTLAVKALFLSPSFILTYVPPIPPKTKGVSLFAPRYSCPVPYGQKLYSYVRSKPTRVLLNS